MAAEFSETTLPEVYIVTPQIFNDSRGFFFESFKSSEFSARGLENHYVQENYSSSKQDVIRGLHYQRPPMAQVKLVRVVSGEIWDVVVDIRPESPSFGRWHAEILSEENSKQLYIPGGFAHGFKVISKKAAVLYRTNSEYSPEHEGGIKWNDDFIGINWKLPNPIISQRDVGLPDLKQSLDRGELDCFR